MNITDVRVRRVAKEGKMKAVVSITIDEEFVVHDIKVIEGEKGLFIAMPSRKATDGEYRDIAHPINSETRERIQGIILEKYEQVLAEEPVEAEAHRKYKKPFAFCRRLFLRCAKENEKYKSGRSRKPFFVPRRRSEESGEKIQ